MRLVPKQPTSISIWAYQAPLRKVAGPRISARAMRVLRGSIVTVICLVAHGLLFTTIMWTAGAPARQPADLPPAVRVASDSSQEAMQWIVLDPHALSDPSRQKLDLPPTHLQSVDLRKELSEVAVVIQDIDIQPTPDATLADAGRLSKLYGRYVGQISARIDRAWLRPRTPIGAASFSCRVRILQDTAGNVTEVTLEQCNGDTRWQLSLVHAIDSASPLPAPPDPDVFSRTLHLGFTAEAYSGGLHEDQYEPEIFARAAQQTIEDKAASDAVTHAFAEPNPDGVIRLTIVGAHVNDVQGNVSTNAPQQPDAPATEDSPQ
jgi:hypothetical protein